MIWVSAKKNDAVFRIRVMRAASLSPRPLQDSAKQEGAYYKSSKFFRQVERFPWGAVASLANLETGEDYTVVLRGSLDVWTGTVTDGGAKDFLAKHIPWYGEMIEEQKQAVTVPPCPGYHAGPELPPEERVICDGGINPETNEKEPPCSWREHCIAFQAECAARNVEPVEALAGKDPKEVIQVLVDVLRRKEAAKTKTAKPKPPAVPPAKKEAKPKPAPTAKPKPAPVAEPVEPPKAKRVRRDERQQEEPEEFDASNPFPTVARETKIVHGAELAERVSSLTTLAVDLGKKIATVMDRPLLKSRAGARPGDLFFVDRREKSSYLAFYAEPNEGKAWPIFCAKFKPQMMEFHVKLALPADTPELTMFDTTAIQSGKFTCLVRVPADEMEPFGDAMLLMLEQGTIRLPQRIEALRV